LSKRFSVIIIPEENSRVRRLRIHSSLVISSLCCCLVVVALLTFFAYSYVNNSVDLDELHRLRTMTSQQRQKVHWLVADLHEIHEQIDLLKETEARIRQLANLDTGAPNVQVAIGGFAETKLNVDVDDIQRQINRLQIEIELRRQSQEVVRNFLNDQISLRRATPSGWPTKGWLTSYFGMRKSPFTGRMAMHEGLDIAASVGTPVHATADGVVARVRYSRSFGKTVAIDHGYGYRTIFAHNSKILVKVGEHIKRGDIVARVGNTGRSTGAHLHYELRLNGVPIDPRKTL